MLEGGGGGGGEINPLNTELNPICRLLSIIKSSPYTPR
jgi:hypothetical protein